jgi:hypothetical protein
VKLPVLFLLSAALAGAQTKVPDLAQLKVAAEGGDAVAQFDYGSTIWASNPKESFSMKLKSADQGYAPAEDAIGGQYASQAPFAQDGGTMQRLAVRYTSRAAFKGIPASQARLSEFYAAGKGVPKDPMRAYGWLAIAGKTANGLTAPLVYKVQLDQLIAKTPSDVIVAGEKFANAFRPSNAAFNAVEADIVVAQLKLTAFFKSDGKAGVLVNGARFIEGETKTITVDEAPVALTCDAITAKSARMRIGAYEFTLTGK